MKLADGPIAAGYGISGIQLGMKRSALIRIIGRDYSTKKIASGQVIQIKNAMFWIQHNHITQIGVFGDFGGQFMDCIGIGSTLSDIVKLIGPYADDLHVYIIPQYPGICSELEDIEEWDELRAPIERIYVYPMQADG